MLSYALFICFALGLLLYFTVSNSKWQRLGEHLVFWSIGAFLIAVAPLAIGHLR